MNRARPVLWAVAVILPVALSSGCGSAGKPDGQGAATTRLTETGALPARTSISVTLDAPPEGALVASPPGAVTLEGTASVGAGAVAPATIVFAVEASLATQGSSAGVCDPGATGNATILGCEVAAALDANAKADPAKVTQAGVVVFGGGDAAASAAARADMSADAGDQPLTAPGAGVVAVLQSIATGKVSQFAERTVATAAPSFAAGLEAAGALAGAGPGKTVVILTSGANGAGPAVSAATFPDKVVVRAFALGDHACAVDASGFGSLDAVAARGAPGSTCQRLASLSDMPDVTAPEKTSLQSLEVTVDGAPPASYTATITPALPQDGPVTVQFRYQLAGLLPGSHQLCVKATGVDSGGPGSVDACVTVTVASIAVAPAQHVSELGTPGQTHTVVATVAAGAAGAVPGVPVAFDVASGPNAGATGAMTTDASGQASFTYTARQHLPGLGTDVINACFTDAQGAKACASATQTWQDTTPPVPSCPPGPNPGGNTPGSSGNGQNPSGFYRLLAMDAVDPDPQVFLKDSGSGVVFGPFHSGIAIKYTQAPGATPVQKGMAGEVAWHITGKGDAQVYARDAVGNVAAPIGCTVPPTKK
jgi:hypothetical protein